MSKSPLPPKRRKAREALPAIYVGTRDGRLVPYAWSTHRFTVRQVRQYGFKCDRIVKYVPAPATPRRRSR